MLGSQLGSHFGASKVSLALRIMGLKDRSKAFWSLKLWALYLVKCASLRCRWKSGQSLSAPVSGWGWGSWWLLRSGVSRVGLCIGSGGQVTALSSPREGRPMPGLPWVPVLGAGTEGYLLAVDAPLAVLLGWTLAWGAGPLAWPLSCVTGLSAVRVPFPQARLPTCLILGPGGCSSTWVPTGPGSSLVAGFSLPASFLAAQGFSSNSLTPWPPKGMAIV